MAAAGRSAAAKKQKMREKMGDLMRRQRFIRVMEVLFTLGFSLDGSIVAASCREHVDGCCGADSAR